MSLGFTIRSFPFIKFLREVLHATWSRGRARERRFPAEASGRGAWGLSTVPEGGTSWARDGPKWLGHVREWRTEAQLARQSYTARKTASRRVLRMLAAGARSHLDRGEWERSDMML